MGVGLWKQPEWQLVALMVFQGWYCLYVLYHQPYKSRVNFVVEWLPEAALFMILVFTSAVAFHPDHGWYVLPFISMIHGCLVTIICFVPTMATLLHYHHLKKNNMHATNEQDSNNNNNGNSTEGNKQRPPDETTSLLNHAKTKSIQTL